MGVGDRLSSEGARIFSVVGVVLLSGGLLVVLFHDVDTVVVSIEGPRQLAAEAVTFDLSVLVPAGQLLPVAGQTLVLEDAASAPPLLVESATCWGDEGCAGGLRYTGRNAGAIRDVARGDDGAQPQPGLLWVRVQGYGHSEGSGYGQEVESDRKLVANDLIDDEGRRGHGDGYGDPENSVTLRYALTFDPATLRPGEYHLTFLVETGSAQMGAISSPRFTFERS